MNQITTDAKNPTPRVAPTPEAWDFLIVCIMGETIKAINTNKDIRREAYKISDLPYCFNYKIRRYFEGKRCPLCNAIMRNYDGSPTKATVQHNVPISKGGKHDLDNISVICYRCNVSIGNREITNISTEEVKRAWEKILYAEDKSVDWFFNVSVLDELD